MSTKPFRSRDRGQAFVELALVLPLIIIMALAVFDFARVFTAAITIEAAAREAADYGGLYPWHWKDAASAATTETMMETRACSAASTLTGYVGDIPDSDPATPVTCTNPEVDVELINDTGFATCYEVPRDQAPCRVKVTVTFDFTVVTPLRLQFGDTELGLPSAVTIVRDSTFAVSNFELDVEPSP
ncbi:MAG TPA: TadE family protein [Candidatus Limnocylindria bacterium]|nr:TadE family protein [Candidatus Limnocylindria bacterium]